jgi:hypothetical protein
MRIVEQLSVFDHFCALALSGGHVTRPRSDTKKYGRSCTAAHTIRHMPTEAVQSVNAAVGCFVPSELRRR